MTDSVDEWDGGAIDGRDQYISDAPYWSNGDGETVDATDPDATGEMTTENVPDPGDEPERDDTDESETDEPEVPVWPPNPETLTEVRRRLLNGESTYEVSEWAGASSETIGRAARGDRHSDVGADIPPLNAERNGPQSVWVVDETETETEPETERPDNGKWGGGIGTYQYLSDHPNWNDDGETDDATESDSEPESETATTDAEEEPEPEPGQQESGLVSGDERPVARDPPEPETPTVPTRWIVAGVAFVAGWILSRLVRGGDGR